MNEMVYVKNRESLKKLKPCPFCQSDHTNDWTWISQVDDQFLLLHYCTEQDKYNRKYNRVITVYGATPEECVERWNADGKEQTSESL